MFLPGPSASWWSPRWFQGTLPSWPGSRRRWPAWWRPRTSRQRHGYRPGPGARPQIAAGPEPRQRWTGSGRYSTCRYSTPGPRDQGQPHAGAYSNRTHNPPPAPPGYTPRMAPGCPNSRPRAPYWSGGQWTAKRAILGHPGRFCRSGAKSRAAPCPVLPGWFRGVLAGSVCPSRLSVVSTRLAAAFRFRPLYV